MTIEKGKEWGTEAVAPAGIRAATSDRELAELLATGAVVSPVKGDLARTIGVVVPPTEGSLARRLDVDLLAVELVIGERVVVVDAIAHVVMRERRLVGGRLRGRFFAVMNAQYLRGRDVVPRGHPNDGRCEIISVDSAMGPRQRILAWSRARTGRHLPHPRINVRSTSEWSVPEVSTQAAGLVVVIDGVRWGVARSVTVRVRPDAASVWV
ncbi:MAG: hypothetical protein ACO3DM_00380 [Ilumatobacteraceae bacterium]